MSSLKWIRSPVMAVAALSVAACSGGASRPKPAPLPSAVSSTAETDAIALLLDQGQVGAARKRLKAVLKDDPMNSAARLLDDSLDHNPKELLGPDSYPYTVRAGDTITGLAQRFLGNRLKAYQLGRYNELKAPITLVAGQTLRIPGELPRVEPVHRPAPVRPSPAPNIVRPKPSLPKPGAAPSTNPAASRNSARQARTAGLTALNQGNVLRAVGLLRRAAALDPGNPLITRDLARAERIAATVKARRP